VTHDLPMRVILSLLGTCIVGAWLHSGARGAARSTLYHQFYEQLELELFDITFDYVGGRRRGAEDDTATVLVATTGVGSHLTPTKKTKRKRSGEEPPHRVQRNCRVCKRLERRR
jgi:hypothetical protein